MQGAIRLLKTSAMESRVQQYSSSAELSGAVQELRECSVVVMLMAGQSPKETGLRIYLGCTYLLFSLPILKASPPDLLLMSLPSHSH